MNLPASNIRSPQPAKLPIGVSDFAELVRESYAFVDKTAMIHELVQTGAKVTLINRPRRFGKTLNLSMLQHFFAAEVNRKPTQGLFEGLAVAEQPAAMAHQGRYPVIFLTFKDIKGETYEQCKEDLRSLLAELYEQYPQLLDSPHVSASQRRRIQVLLDQQASRSDLGKSLKLLSELLYKHYGQEVVILLDEYDTPMHAAYSGGYYRQLIPLMRTLLSAALKDNPYLFKGVVTGIMQVSKENIFSGLNNLDVYTVLQERYSACFGFTEAEVAGFLQATGFAAQHPKLEGEIKRWYNGYRFGADTLYNPWSIISCLSRNGKLESYWTHTGADEVLRTLMAQADASFKIGLEQLLQGGTVIETVDPKLTFEELDGNSTALWSLLLFSGYLTAEDATATAEDSVVCRLRIPNAEITGLYRRYIKEWFTRTLNAERYVALLRSLAEGDVAGFEALLREYLLGAASYFDVQGKAPEKFYHGLVLGMLVGLHETHLIDSNRESGEGRYDVAILPKAGTKHEVGIILEFKKAAESADLAAAAQTALTQIDARHYHKHLRRHPVKSILCIGIAFAGKEMQLAYTIGKPTTSN